MRDTNFVRNLIQVAVAATLVVSCSLPAIGKDIPNTGKLAARLQHYVDENVMAGAVMVVADKDKILDLETVGYSDLATKKPMRPDNVFWIASMSKAITSAALMMLVDEGKVKIDDPVEKYIPEIKNVKVLTNGVLVEPSHPIIIREILSHTSGMRFLNTMDNNIIDAVPLEESIMHNLKDPLLSQPGTVYRYSNEGIDTAGLIIQRVSGMPYEKFLKKRLFDPLEMKDTTFTPSASQLKRLAKSYKTTPKGLEEVPINQLKQPLGGKGHYPSPAGGLFSTAIDCAHFCQMLASGGTYKGKRYLSEEAVKTMTSKQTPDSVKENYGFGLSVGNGYFGHGGAYNTHM
ncbi:MAG TPA: serine hydrolase domain-containing protein, partial [Verrucomicrobiota bacterium]|nr:serine hydrolase domain-containing protein [Verrucomicrobiota bacterium]